MADSAFEDFGRARPSSERSSAFVELVSDMENHAVRFPTCQAALRPPGGVGWKRSV
ncbi:uncharacterized protein V6R79_024184 [Siganus canaliculatus]